MQFNNINDLLEYFGCDTFEMFEHHLYRCTDSGMPVRFNGKSITLTGYVENDSDYCGRSETLYFPFTLEKLDLTIKKLEERALYEWSWLNEDLHDLGLSDKEIEMIEDEDEYRWTMVMEG